jgi:hypothetical protein
MEDARGCTFFTCSERWMHRCSNLALVHVLWSIILFRCWIFYSTKIFWISIYANHILSYKILSLLRLCIFIIYKFYGFKGISWPTTKLCILIYIYMHISWKYQTYSYSDWISNVYLLMIFMCKVDESWDWSEGLYRIAESFSLNYGFEVEFGLIRTNLYQSWFDLWFLGLNWKNELLACR